jgi:lipopolysaccharide biosynthesis glycosyltransferase
VDEVGLIRDEEPDVQQMIHLAIAFDENYARPFHALLASIASNAGPAHLHVIATGVNEQHLDQIRAYVRRHSMEITFYTIEDTRVGQLITRDTWTTAVYYRLYFPLLVNHTVRKLLYIDTDTLVLNNLSELYHWPLDGYPVAAVYDNYVKTQPMIGMDTPGEYLNSGVLLIDTQAWRDQKISEKAIDYLLTYPERIRYVDQCALNAVLRHNWLHLDTRYNLLYTYLPEEQSKQQVMKVMNDAVIVHFNLERPWHMLCKNRLRVLYRKYLNAYPNGDSKVISDFTAGKIPAWLTIRLKEFYLDSEWLKATWRRLKR